MASEAVISSLKNIDCFHIVGCDIYPYDWIYTSNLVDTFYQVPRANSDLYLKKILEICEVEKVQYLIPLTDLEVDILSENIDVFRSQNVMICISDLKVIQICRDKFSFYKLFKDVKDVKVIPTYTYHDIDRFFYPMIAKPRKGRSSEGLFIAKNREVIDSIIDDVDIYVFQPYLKGEIYTVDFIRDGRGSYFHIPRKELLRTKNGAGITVELKKNPQIKKILEVIVEYLPIKGCLNLEFLYDGDTYYLMDINPRFSAGIAFSQLAGYDFVYNHLKVFMGLTIDIPIDYSSMIMCKRYSEYINNF